MSKIIVISVGGSIIAPRGIDVVFLKKFRALILSHIRKGYRFILIAGGGHTSRVYQDAAKKITRISDTMLDWIGIRSTHLNAELLLSMFEAYAHSHIIVNPSKKITWKSKVLIAAGWKPGASTDYDAVLLAKQFNAQRMINLSNIDYVYDKDPTRYKTAQKFSSLEWSVFCSMFPGAWHPGLHAPFDPVAARLAKKLHLEVAVINGTKLKEVDKYLLGKKFIGTRISN